MKRFLKQIEVLESRRMMSASPFNAAVAADRLEVRVDLLKFRADAAVGAAAVLHDLATMKGDGLAKATTVTPLIKQFHTDLKSMGQTLFSDRLTEKVAALTDEVMIVKELQKIFTDRKNPAAKASDETALTTDRVQLQTDLIAGLDARIATREAAEVTIDNDVAAINSAASSDPNASAKLKTDMAKLLADRTAKMATLTADLQKLEGDRTTLSTALSAD